MVAHGLVSRTPVLRRTVVLTACLMTVALAQSGCSDEATRPESLPPPPSSPSREARLIALYASGDLEPPDSLARIVQGHLSAIRDAYRATCPFVDSVSFRPTLPPSYITLGVDASTITAIQEDRYHAWDSLNTRLGILDIDKEYLVSQRLVILRFRDLLHPRRLAPFYAHLPGVRYTEPGGYSSDFSNVWPLLRGSHPTYLFRKGGGDCPVGCTENYYWYFSILPDGPHLVGTWDGRWNSQPDWWDNAKLNQEEFRRWMRWP